MIKYMFKSAIRDKELIFYLFFFPLLMLTIQSLAFSALSDEKITIKLAAEAGNPSLQYLKQIPIFEMESLSRGEAISEMTKGEIVGFVEDETLIVQRGGFLPTIAKTAIDTFKQMERLELPIRNYDFSRTFTRNLSRTNNGLEGFKIIFYTFIAMIALQSAHISMNFINGYRANQSFMGQRIEIAPVKKHIVLLNTLVVSFVINFAALMTSILYCEFVLHIPLLINVFESLAILVALNLLGITFGICIGAGPRIREGAKVAIITTTLLSLGMLSGMMSLQFKNFLTRFVPWIDAVNPLALFSDAILRINISGDSSLFLPTLLTILLESLVMFVALLLIIRRRKYDHI